MAIEIGLDNGSTILRSIRLSLDQSGEMTWEHAEDKFDDATYIVGQDVRYSVLTPANGTFKIFVGEAEPVQRRLPLDQAQYTAVDPMGFLGHNPCPETFRFYNKPPEGDIFPQQYPTDQSIRQIIESEFVDVVGSLAGSPSDPSLPIGTIDWTTYASTKADLFHRK